LKLQLPYDAGADEPTAPFKFLMMSSCSVSRFPFVLGPTAQRSGQGNAAVDQPDAGDIVASSSIT
jgi:hypothetical protein